MRRSSTNPRSGYALLMIFCMAAMVSIMLYSQMPRVAFEAQRDKEAVADRSRRGVLARDVALRAQVEEVPGHHSRRWRTPTTSASCASATKIRLTGKEEWRLIHVGPNGVFTDSIVYGKKDKDTKEQQTFITELPMSGTPAGGCGNQSGHAQTAERWPERTGHGRSDQWWCGGERHAGESRWQHRSPNQRAAANDRSLPPGQISGLPPGVQLPAGIGSQQQPGLLPGQPGAPATSPTAGTAYSTALGANGQTPTPFGQQPGTSGAASDMIRNLLTSPRPGGQFGTPAAASGTPAQTTIGGGIAGVASNLEREGIKIYKEKTAYNEWEFVYDMSKDPTMANNGAGQTAAPRTGQPGVPGVPGQQPTTPIPAPRPPGQ